MLIITLECHEASLSYNVQSLFFCIKKRYFGQTVLHQVFELYIKNVKSFYFKYWFNKLETSIFGLVIGFFHKDFFLFLTEISIFFNWSVRNYISLSLSFKSSINKREIHISSQLIELEIYIRKKSFIFTNSHQCHFYTKIEEKNQQ